MLLRAVNRLHLLLVLVLSAVLVLAVAPQPAAAHHLDQNSLDRIHEARRAADREPLAVCEELNRVARAWSARMAEDGRLRHNASVGDHIGPWWRWAENVGVGASTRQVHDALMRSRGHRENLLHEDVQQVGVGVTHARGRVWVTQIFRDPRSGARCTRPSTP